jgi:hypothetical protein
VNRLRLLRVKVDRLRLLRVKVDRLRVDVLLIRR